MIQQSSERVRQEHRAQKVMLQLMCAVSIWRTAATRIIPVYGTGSWWIMIVCLLPGFAVAMILQWSMSLTRTTTLLEAERRCLGRAGAVLFSAAAAALLLSEGTASLTALLTMFTQGVGTKGTQFTLAVLTCGVMLFSLHREGLPRAVYLLRWLMTAAAIVLVVYLAADAEIHRLFPLEGTVLAENLSAADDVLGLSWPVILFLFLPDEGVRGHAYGGILPSACAVGMILLTALIVPHEMLARTGRLANQMLLPAWYTPNAIRVVWLCLLMLGFFFSIAGSVRLAADQMSVLLGKSYDWIAVILLIVLMLTQAVPPAQVWTILPAVRNGVFMLLAAGTIIILVMAMIRRARA